MRQATASLISGAYKVVMTPEVPNRQTVRRQVTDSRRSSHASTSTPQWSSGSLRWSAESRLSAAVSTSEPSISATQVSELVCKPSGMRCEMQRTSIWLKVPSLWHARLAIVEDAGLRVSVQISPDAGKEQVLRQLARIIDPDFGQDIVSCGFVKGLMVDPQSGQVTFALELTTPACPIKDEFERKARDYVAELHWVQQVQGPASLMQLPARHWHLWGPSAGCMGCPASACIHACLVG